ncbi:FtsX-like permease family protein [Bacillus sp. THAF10]|uniref:ABC transporter permease n=1 Tax=Bacillus sp. THAF10 TaxID=2587848 RepID=UPI00126793E5|nr:ABC transporter permease [Bacillus sp. THAF10]QFT89682.1 FtsX-like permease family protein [Bacillus sp. THAF10]
MIRFIWQNWWRRKERFLLLILGAFIISAGLTYLIGLSDTNKGTVVETLQQRWTASYDIVVRPQGTESLTEEKKLLEPNYLSGLSGGISLEQYETIKGMEGIEVAAPIAMIGYADYQVNFGKVELNEDGIYRRSTITTIDNGLEKETSLHNYYFPVNVWDIHNKGPEYGVAAPYQDLTVYSHTLLAGIDPEQEAKLVGLDHAIIDLGKSRYFKSTDKYAFHQSGEYHEFPIIVNRQAFVDKMEKITFERIDIAITRENADEVMEDVKTNGGVKYLDSLTGQAEHSFTVSGEEAFHEFVRNMTGVDWNTGKVFEESNKVNTLSGIVFKPTSIEYQEIASPSSDRWPYAYQVTPIKNGEEQVGVYKNLETYRNPQVMAENFLDLPKIKPNWIGFYNASKLSISKDPTNELPMETYRPATAEFVMDSDGMPVNPPTQLKPNDDPYSFLTNPPGMLTTIEAAEKLLGDKPISSIRVKVAGVNDLSEDSQQILEHIAAEIELKTGLKTDITMGSSPQLALTFIPGLNGKEDIGWIQQPWVNIGSSISIFRETKIGYVGILASVIAVAVVYVWSSGIVHLLARRKEFAVLLAIGWRPSQLRWLLLSESSIIGAFVAFTSWMMMGIIYLSSDSVINLNRFVFTGIFGLLVYLLGAIIPIVLIQEISPYEAMRQGEISIVSKRLVQAKGIYGMAFNHFVGKWKRSILSVISISLPTALLAFFLYITFRLRGIMYTSILGEYVALEIGPMHYTAIIIALIIAILTTSEIMWQNVSERQEEISLLQALGWRRWSIRKLILAEGLFSGIFAACLGLSLSIGLIIIFYGELPSESFSIILATGIIPITIGLMGTILPAEKAVNIVPNQGMHGSISHRKMVEKRLKWTLILTSTIFFLTFVFIMIRIIPNMEVASSSEEISTSYSPTSGTIIKKESVKDVHEKTYETEDANEDQIEYSLDFHSSQSSLDTTMKKVLDYSALEVESQRPNDAGMKNIAIEFSFEILEEHTLYAMTLKRDFLIIAEGEKYWPVEVTVLEAKGWDEKELLWGNKDGKIRAVLEYSVPESIENFNFLFRNNHTGPGFMIRFD